MNHSHGSKKICGGLFNESPSLSSCCQRHGLSGWVDSCTKACSVSMESFWEVSVTSWPLSLAGSGWKAALSPVVMSTAWSRPGLRMRRILSLAVPFCVNEELNAQWEYRPSECYLSKAWIYQQCQSVNKLWSKTCTVMTENSIIDDYIIQNLSFSIIKSFFCWAAIQNTVWMFSQTLVSLK